MKDLTTDWFLELPHDVAGAIANSHTVSKFGRFLSEYLWPIILIILLSLVLRYTPLQSLLNSTSAKAPTNPPWHLIMESVTLIVLLLVLSEIAQIIVHAICLIASAPIKGALYAGVTIAKLTERDLLIASRRRVCLEGDCDPNIANQFINEDCRRRIRPILIRVLLIIFALFLLRLAEIAIT